MSGTNRTTNPSAASLFLLPRVIRFKVAFSKAMSSEPSKVRTMVNCRIVVYTHISENPNMLCSFCEWFESRNNPVFNRTIRLR
jgi:hypothetical protein